MESKKKRIHSSVITGGACAGKTQSLPYIVSFLENEGYTVFIGEEAATSFIRQKVTPSDVTLRVFQKLILDKTYDNENYLFEAAQYVQNDRVFILFDRGILDNRSYISHELFAELREAKGLTEEEILDRYDLIIHLVSVAEDKEEYWNPEGRLETLEEAKALEKRTREAWPDIPKKHVVRNNGGFEEKVEEILAIYEEYIESLKRRYIIREVNSEGFNKFLEKKEKTTSNSEGQKRYKILDNGITYMLGIYQDGSNMMTLEVNDGSPLPNWLLKYEEITKQQNKLKERKPIIQ